MKFEYNLNPMRPEGLKQSIIFAIAFINRTGKADIYTFVDSSLSQCVIKCTAFINYMFQFCHMNTVYIFPTNDNTTYRNVFRQEYGFQGDFKMLLCDPNLVLTYQVVRERWFGV